MSRLSKGYEGCGHVALMTDAPVEKISSLVNPLDLVKYTHQIPPDFHAALQTILVFKLDQVFFFLINSLTTSNNSFKGGLEVDWSAN